MFKIMIFVIINVCNHIRLFALYVLFFDYYALIQLIILKLRNLFVSKW